MICPYCGRPSLIVVDEFVSGKTIYYLESGKVGDCEECQNCEHLACKFCGVSYWDCDPLVTLDACDS